MELTSPSVIKYLLKKYGLWAKKSFGQHFLIDKNILEKILDAAGLSKKDVVLEIGPGIGTLTKALCQQVKRVITVEIDKGMVKILKETLKDVGNVEIVEGDILKLNPKSEFLISKSPLPAGSRQNAGQIQNQKYKIVANIPYQITSLLLEKFLTSPKKPKLLVLLIQKEVAQKICSKPPTMNRLGILVQFYGKPKIISYVSKNSFWPKPEVESAILRITLNKKLKIKNQKDFFDIVKQGFSQKRKQLKNIFEEAILKKVGIMPKKRAEELELEDWIKLYETYKEERQ